jgi:hypothetical protein
MSAAFTSLEGGACADVLVESDASNNTTAVISTDFFI